MRSFKWNPWFEPKVETTIGVAWISFPDLPLNFFAKNYDYIPKYCKECCLQGHDRHTCWALHLELYETRSKEEKNKKDKGDDVTVGTQREYKRVLMNGRIVGYKQTK
ncbi:hypothetical protein H5410_052621 [Solanum commersonii]|uniref:DUF4283 domain-containing protein n=1 Tax=Solanum commersonii TaxID=4109 RepID=A0A9J5X204_SOLCO|nr:hypothetical protein H5410_052621 [Solanum commersonii]